MHEAGKPRESAQRFVLFAQWRAGDPAALESLIPLVYGELRRIAHGYLRGERPGHTLLDEALNGLARLDEQQAQIVELRFFGGLSVGDTATALGVSPATVKREWATARAWLSRELQA
jgi:ECF sigma factor